MSSLCTVNAKLYLSSKLLSLTWGREQGYDFVAYPNRDSVPFREFYKIPEAETVIRVSLRYEGNPALIKALVDAGWLDGEEKEWLKPGITWAEITQRVISATDTSERYILLPNIDITSLIILFSSSLVATIKERCKFRSEAESERITSGMRYFGLLSSEEATIRGSNLLDTLCSRLEKLLSFQPGERDLVMLQHKFVVEWEDGKRVSCFKGNVLLAIFELIILFRTLLP